MDFKSSVNALVSAIKKVLADSRKANKATLSKWTDKAKETNFNGYLGWGGQRQLVDIYHNSDWKGLKWEIRIDDWQGKQYLKDASLSDVRMFFDALRVALDELRKTKGWGGLYWDWNYDRDAKYYSISKVGVAEAPCKEFKSLVAYVSKYAKTTISPYYLYSARMGGKRGYLWDEYGERLYLDCKCITCREVLAELRKNRGAKDKLSVTFGSEKWIDPIDRAYSEKYEVECDGERRVYAVLTIKTPQGKVKYERKVY